MYVLIVIKNQLYKVRGLDLSYLLSEDFNCRMNKDSLIFRFNQILNRKSVSLYS